MIFHALGATARTALRAAGFTFRTISHRSVPVVLWQKRMQKEGSDPRGLVMVPGFGDTPVSWLPFTIELLRAGRLRVPSITLIELPGGLGSKHQGPGIGSADLLYDVVSHTLQALQPRFLVGQSMGGYLVIHHLAHGKWPVEKAVAMCPSGLMLAGQPLGDWANALNEVGEGKPDGFVERAVHGLDKNLLLRLPARAFGNELRRYLLRDDVKKMIASLGPQDALDDHIERINTPTLLVWGKRDVLVPYTLFPEWKQRLLQSPGAAKHRFLEVAHAGHGVHVEAAPVVANAVLDFLCEPTN